MERILEDDMIEVMKAFTEGKEIQCKVRNSETEVWHDCEEPEWNWVYYNYRIKPEVEEYRAYCDTDELFEDFEERACCSYGYDFFRPHIWLKEIDDETLTHFLISAFAKYTICVGGRWINMYELFRKYTYLDGSPCGKLVEE